MCGAYSELSQPASRRCRGEVLSTSNAGVTSRSSLFCPLYLVRIKAAGRPWQGRESRAVDGIPRDGCRESSEFRPGEGISIPLTRVCAIIQGRCDVERVSGHKSQLGSPVISRVFARPQADRGPPDNVPLVGSASEQPPPVGSIGVIRRAGPGVNQPPRLHILVVCASDSAFPQRPEFQIRGRCANPRLVTIRLRPRGIISVRYASCYLRGRRSADMRSDAFLSVCY